MRKVREVLRLHFECGCTHRQIAAACSISPATVSDYVNRAERAGFDWEQARPLGDAEVEARLFSYIGRGEPAARGAIDFAWVHRELGRVGVTLQLLWGEYQAAAQTASVRAYQYSQFCELYAGWRGQRRLSMRQVHRPGEKLFIDYSGKRPSVCDPQTGEMRAVELFVAVLGASNYTFAEVTLSQSVPNFTASIVRALEYFEAAPSIVVSDQLKSAVKKSDRYDPDINDALQELAQHYSIAAIPAPPASPRAKAKVETGVLIAQRWILARLRNLTFFSLAELNNASAELVEELNTRRFQKLPGTRREAFETLDRPSMKPLPRLRFELRQRKGMRANIDYHVDFDDRLYSVPFVLRQKQIEVRATTTIVECFHDGVRVASHRRSYARKGTAVTDPKHRPKSHEDYGEWPPERMLGWAEKFGPHVLEVVRRTLDRYPQPEMGYRPVLGILRCAEKHGAERMDAACLRALSVAGTSAPHRRYIEGILKRGLDRSLPLVPATTSHLSTHEFVRGASYFDKEEDSDHRRNHQQAHRPEAAHAGQEPARDAGHAPGQTTLVRR
jgi:transposase